MSLGRILLLLWQFVVAPGPRYSSSFLWWRWRHSRKILATQPVHTRSSDRGTVRYLVCHNQVLEAVWSAKSLLADDEMRDWALAFHDDGTLSPRDLSVLAHHFPSAKIIKRQDADSKMKNILPPACKSLRDSLVLSLKLFDFAHFSHGHPYLALDTDVLFFKNPVELSEILSRRENRIRWNQDPPGAVSFSHGVDEIFEKTGIKPERFNSGVLAIPSPFTDWEQIETWLVLLGKPQMIWTAEQTIYALIAVSQGGTPLPATYDIREKHWPDVVSEHYYWHSRRNMYRLGYPAVFDRRLSYCRLPTAET
jgi:hypothetical protein